ncbi:hypothetical protein A3860_17535 [Niastella vici]|uniref:Uncharacterized protein n=1 Tax=Niastella vici TaxID=1703345 RepID=A0A1V9G4E9_9BACT|nr:hypothetical protein [Niastella vici]OQP65467.1 hypothetical protein A3860_17535 [Niastella vici]
MKTNKQNAGAQMPTRFTYYADAGHAWLEVPYSALLTLNLHHQITGFSYRQNDMVYLEEDYDAVLFVKAYLSYIGKKENDYEAFRAICSQIHDGNYSQIRNYRHYHTPAGASHKIEST